MGEAVIQSCASRGIMGVKWGGGSRALIHIQTHSPNTYSGTFTFPSSALRRFKTENPKITTSKKLKNLKNGGSARSTNESCLLYRLLIIFKALRPLQILPPSAPPPLITRKEFQVHPLLCPHLSLTTDNLHELAIHS